jgi:histidine triad (HIT) family protein
MPRKGFVKENKPDTRSIFTMILQGDIPGKFVSETYKYFAIHDVEPRADVHVLVIPATEVRTLIDMEPHKQAELFREAFRVAKEFLHLSDYWLEVNVNRPYQEVFHVHVHVLSADVEYKGDRPPELKTPVSSTAAKPLTELDETELSELIEQTLATATNELALPAFRIQAHCDGSTPATLLICRAAA